MLNREPKGLFIIFCMLFCSSLQCFATMPDTLLMKPGIYEPSLRNYYIYFKDETNGNLNNAISQLQFGNFTKNTKYRILNEPETAKPYWIALYIKNDTTIDFPITWNFYEDGILFSVYNVTNASQPQLIGSYSTATPTNKRGLAVRCVSFKVLLPHGQIVKLLAKCNITTSNQMYVPTDVTTPDDILQYEMDYCFLVGRYFGFFLFALLFNLLVWAFTQNSLYIWQFFYIASISLFNVVELLFDAMLLPEWLHQLIVLIPKNTFFTLSIFFAINVFEHFTELKQSFNKSYRYLQWLKATVIVLIALFVIPLFFWSSGHPIVLNIRNFATILSLISYFIFIIFILVGCFKKNVLHILYFLSAFLILLGFISFVLNGYFKFMIYHIEPGNMMVGLGVELLLQTLFFSYRHQFLKLSVKRLTKEKIEIEQNISQSVLQAQELERVKISEDLHDQLGNDFLGLKMLTDRMSKMNESAGYPITESLVSEMKGLIADMVDNVRYITHSIAHINIEDKGLIALIEQRLLLLNSNSHIHFTFEYRGCPETLSSIANINILRIILEAINNIIKHSEASKAMIQLSIDEISIIIMAMDNGKGFLVNDTMLGKGLYSIKNRADAMSGKFEISSEINNGCIITITIPTEIHKCNLTW